MPTTLAWDLSHAVRACHSTEPGQAHRLPVQRAGPVVLAWRARSRTSGVTAGRPTRRSAGASTATSTATASTSTAAAGASARTPPMPGPRAASTRASRGTARTGTRRWTSGSTETAAAVPAGQGRNWADRRGRPGRDPDRVVCAGGAGMRIRRYGHDNGNSAREPVALSEGRPLPVAPRDSGAMLPRWSGSSSS